MKNSLNFHPESIVPIIKRDFETRSAVDLKKVGARRYAADPTTTVLCICYAVDDGPIESFVPEDGKPVPDVFVEAARNPAWSVCAHNDPFESAIEEYVLGPHFNWPWVPIERHICTMAMARYHGLPGELGKVATLLDLPIQKDRDGTKLMLQLCRPRKPRPGEDPTQLNWVEITPEKLARLIVYCKNDVAVEREIFRRLPLLPDEEHRLWCLDRKINVRGFRGDLEFADSACKLVSAEIAHINAEIRALTGGAVAGFTKLNDMREFVNARGHNMTKLNERAVTAVLAHDPDDTVRAVLELRQASSNTAVAKYTAVLASAFPDQRIYGLLNYYGAHTGRWTSAGFNVHNLPREDSSDALVAIDAIRRGDLERLRAFGPPLEVIARLARGVVIASANKLLLAGDFSVVEPRVASWLTEEKWKLDNFRAFDETGDPMLDAHRVVGARMRGQPVNPTDDEARQHGKTVHMALNYGGSVRVWREHVPDDPRSDEEIKTQEINKFRRLHPAQTQFMFNLGTQALRCVRLHQPVRHKRHSFEMDGDTLILRLPSGRPLFYPRAHLRPGRFGKTVVAYHNPAHNCEDEMWYGAWFAHLVSATSRDLLVNALFNLDVAGFELILHVHDEIVAEIDPANIEHDCERFKACMLAAPAWAKGLPLAAKVRVGPRYIKTDAPIEIKADTVVESGALIVATEARSIQPRDGCLGDTEVPIDFDFRTSELPGGSESEHNLVYAESGAGGDDVILEVHICAQCHLNPPDGSERPSAYNDEWLHPRCEEAFICARMAEWGLLGEAPTEEPPPTAAFGEAPPPLLPPRQINGGAAPTSGNGGDPCAIVSEEQGLQLGPTREGDASRSLTTTFLEKLRQNGPWPLTAIVPNGKITTITARTAEEVAAFVSMHNGRAGLYYAVNPTRTALSKKAAKIDVAAIEYALADLDPADGETSEAAKTRYLVQLEGMFEPKPTAAVDSGNGIQGLWKLRERIVLGEPVNGRFSAEDQAKIDDVEARIAAIMVRLGAKAGTQNIDRILRLPGTINVPNAKKRAEGRIACPTKLLWFNDASYPLDAFPKEEPKASGKKKKASRETDPLAQAIREGAPKGERSEKVWYVINEMLRRGYRAEAIVQVLLDHDNGISQPIYDQAKPHEYAARQVEQATEKIEFLCDKDGKILPIAANIRIALLKLGVSVRHDQFADRLLLDGLPGFGPVLEDAAVNHLWLQFAERFRFFPNLELVRIVMNDVARRNGFHPVCDYLDALQWDGVPRVDKWLITYAGAEDSKYTRAVGALMLIAAVRRIRQPGCKFDEMLVLEQPLQGTDKSSALAVLAVQEDWFADDLPLNVEAKRVIETLRGRWIVEAAELSGMRKADVEHLKATLSRRVDRARMAYGRLPVEVPRQCIIVGTTNKGEYLRDTTGNRRFWPVLVQAFDLDALRSDRDQLWAESAAREAQGESIRLARELWPAAAKEQEQRLADDPFVAVLANHLGPLEGKIKACDVWEILNLHGAQLSQDAYQRASEAMKRIGWKRPNKAGIARFGGQLMAAYVRGASRKVISVVRDRDGLFITEEGETPPPEGETPPPEGETPE